MKQCAVSMSCIYGATMSRTRLGFQMNTVAVEMEAVFQLEKNVRSELRRNGGHKGKVNNRVLLWLDHADRIKKQFTKIWDCYSLRLGLVEFIHLSPCSVVLMFPCTPDFGQYSFFVPEPTLRVALVDKIRDKILEYLDDPEIRTISFYGEGWIKPELIREVRKVLTQSPHKIVRLQLFERTSLKALQLHITTQLIAQMAEDQASTMSANLNQVNKFLIVFDYACTTEPESMDKMRNACNILSFAGYKVNNILCYMYNCHLAFKIGKQILNFTNEVKALKGSYSSLQVMYDAVRADRVPNKFGTPQTLTGKSAQVVSSGIWDYLLDPMIRTIGLYGVGGVGKTTIVKNMCNELADTEIFDMIIWVSLSNTAVYSDNYKRLQDEIAAQLGIKLVGHEDVLKRASRISERLKIFEKCLFILDDVWGRVSLSTIGIPVSKSDHYGCKIVLTTRLRYVCLNMRVDKQIYLEPLSEKEAWDLFVGKFGDQILEPEVESIAKEIVKECSGLPITIVTVSHAMRKKENATAWRLALKDLRGTGRELYGEVIDHVFNGLLFAYNSLKNDQVRLCLLCCAIFPEDYKFDPTELIRYWIWMSKNLLNNRGGIVESINDGLEILKELKDANMLETFMEGGIEWLKLHDLFRNLALIVMRVKLGFFVKAGVGLVDFAGTRDENISLIRNRISKLEMFTLPCSHISTLLLRDNPLDHISRSFFWPMHNLQVLDMSYSGLTELPPSFSELRKLRVLFLNFCTGLEILPSFDNIKDLEVLNLRGTLIKNLPLGIKGLVSLRSLDLSETVRLENIQDGVISSLSNLEELHLQGSLLCKMKSQKVANCLKEIRCLYKLGILTLSAVGFGDHLDTILHLQSHNLKSFSINVYGSTLDYIEGLDDN